jgi:hypothetical protein
MDARERAEAIARDFLTLPRPHELQGALALSIVRAIEAAVAQERLDIITLVRQGAWADGPEGTIEGQIERAIRARGVGGTEQAAPRG